MRLRNTNLQIETGLSVKPVVPIVWVATQTRVAISQRISN